MIYLNSQYAIVSYKEAEATVHVTWKTTAKKENYRYPLEKGLDALNEQQLNKLLADMRALEIMSSKDLDWFVNEWSENALNAGLKYMAVIIPIKNKDEFKSIVDKFIAKGIEYYVFYSEEEAFEWLKNK